MDTMVRWSLIVSKDTDIALRSYLAQQGARKGDLSKFIERAVQREIFERTVADIRARNKGVPAEVIEAEIEDALAGVRTQMLKEGLYGGLKPKKKPRRKAR